MRICNSSLAFAYATQILVVGYKPPTLPPTNKYNSKNQNPWRIKLEYDASILNTREHIFSNIIYTLCQDWKKLHSQCCWTQIHIISWILLNWGPILSKNVLRFVDSSVVFFSIQTLLCIGNDVHVFKIDWCIIIF